MNIYTILSSVYDLLDATYFRKIGRNPRIVINELISNDDVKVLDMCCGTLSNSISIAKEHQNAKILGIDLSKDMLQVAHQKKVKEGLDHIYLKKMDATDTKLKKESFDYIIIGLALHEMDSSLQQNILKEAFRLLKSNGRLIVLEWEQPKSLGQRLLYFPLLIGEQLNTKSFLEFYHCDKKKFFKDNNFDLCRRIHCNYTDVFELKKSEIEV